MFNKSQLALAITAMLAAPILAQAETYTFDEVVVSATRTEQSKQDASSAIETVSSDDIDKEMAGDIKEALKYTPGVRIKGSGRFGISGANIRGVSDSRVKMMVDGVQQPVPYSAGRTEQRSYPNSIEIDTLQRIEINKGPSSTLYGSDALGGVVLLRTKQPQDLLLTDGDETRFGLKSTYSSANAEFKNTLSWANRSGKLETLLMGTYAQGNETETHGSGSEVIGPDRGAANPADTQLANILGKAYYQFSDKQRIGFTAEYYTKDYDEDELNYEGYNAGRGFIYTDNFNQDTNKRLRLSFEHEMLLESLLADSLDWSISYQDSGTQNDNYDTTPIYGKRLRTREATNKSLQLDTQLSKMIMSGENSHEITYGFSYLNTDFELDNIDNKIAQATVTPGSSLIPDATVTQWGIYVQDQARFMRDKLILTAGLRYDDFKADPSPDDAYVQDFPTNEDSAFTAKLGAVYHLNDNLALFSQISQGFKAPTVEDLYYHYDSYVLLQANPNLEAETSLAYELGLRGYYDDVSFELATFYTDYKDFISSVFVGMQDGRSVFTNANLDEVKIYGAEFSSRVHLDGAFNAPKGSYAQLAISYTEGEDKKTGEALDSTAPLTTVLGFGIDKENYGGAIDLTFVAGKDDWNTEDNVDVAGYGLVDLTAYYQPTENLTVSAGLFNAFDKQYWLFDDVAGRTTTNEFNIDGLSQPGRNWKISVNYQF